MTTLKSTYQIPKAHPDNNERRISTNSSDTSSFEEIYKKSYSHGLEAIYALENIDIKSVKRIETAPKNEAKKPYQKKTFQKLLQEELDLGDEYRGWIKPFVLKEPIHVLELSKHAEKTLVEHGKKCLEDLLTINVKDFVFLRGFGQGHIEEIQSKLNLYLEGTPTDKAHKVDFTSWLKCLVGNHDRKKVFALLTSYDLADLFSLSPSESVEVRKLTLEKKLEWNEDIIAKIATVEQKLSVLKDLQIIVSTFIKPWIRRRGGFATKTELEERFQRISESKFRVQNILLFIRDVYFSKKETLNQFVLEIDDGVFCSDQVYALLYDKIIDKALSYFYHTSVYYTLDELIAFLEREFSRSWTGFAEGYIEKVLRISSAFYITKGPKGLLEIYRK